MAAAEIKGDPFYRAGILDVGFWTPVTGINNKDDLFPHVTGGMRGRMMKVSAIHVS